MARAQLFIDGVSDRGNRMHWEVYKAIASAKWCKTDRKDFTVHTNDKKHTAHSKAKMADSLSADRAL